MQDKVFWFSRERHFLWVAESTDVDRLCYSCNVHQVWPPLCPLFVIPAAGQAENHRRSV